MTTDLAALAAEQRNRQFNAGRSHPANASDPIFTGLKAGAGLVRFGGLAFTTLALTLIFWPAALAFLLIVLIVK